MAFLPTSFFKGDSLFKPTSQNWPRDRYVIMTKMNEQLKALFIGIRWDQNAKCNSEGRRAKILGHRLASTHV